MPKYGETRFDPNDKYEQQAWDGTNWISTSEFRKKNDNQALTVPAFGVTRFDPNDKYEQQAWDGSKWISTSEFAQKYGTKNTQPPATNVSVGTNSTPITDKQYQRDVNFGDFSLTGQSSNGINVTKDGNIFQYTSNNQTQVQSLRDNQYNGPLAPNDPNNNASFIGMFVAGTTDVKLGNPTQQTLNKNIDPPKEVVTPDKKTPPAKAILIGDSLVPLLAHNSKKLSPLTPEGVLWKGGIAMNVLTKYVKAYHVDNSITHVFISIGSNDRYEEFKAAPISPFVKLLKEKFPNASNSIYLIKGDYGYDGVVEGGPSYFGGTIVNLPKRRTDYFAKWTAAGVKLVNQEVGYADRHPGYDYPSSMKVIGKEIDELIGTVNALPGNEVNTPKPSPKVINKATPIPDKITTDEDDLMEVEYENLPNEEGTQLFDVIRVDQNIQDDVPVKKSPSLIGDNRIIQQIESNNGGKVPSGGDNFTKYGSQFALVQNDGTLGNQYYYSCALFNQGDPQWGSLYGGGYTLKAAGCCYNSVCMIATHAKNNAGYTPKWFWDNASKSTVVYWDVLAKAVGQTGHLVSTTKTSIIDERLKKGPMAFEWDNTNKAYRTSYAKRYTKRHHWMVINGRNSDGTYTIFDPNGGKIWKNQTKEAIEAGLIRIFYF
jgi:hypothetical protein